MCFWNVMWQLQIQLSPPMSITLMPNKFVGCSLSPGLSNDVYSMVVNITKHFLLIWTQGESDFSCFLLFFSLKSLKSEGFPHKKFLFSKSNASSSGLRKKFLDPGTSPNMFPDTFLRCRVSSETNGVIIWHIYSSILHKTSANTYFSNLVLAQNSNLERQKPSKSAIFGVLRDFKCC